MIDNGALTSHCQKLEAVPGIGLGEGPGEISGYFGPGGAVKTTNIRMLTDLRLPTSRSGTVVGFDILREQARTDSEVGYVSQKFSFRRDLTIKVNIDCSAGLFRMIQRQRPSSGLITVSRMNLRMLCLTLGGSAKIRRVRIGSPSGSGNLGGDESAPIIVPTRVPRAIGADLEQMGRPLHPPGVSNRPITVRKLRRKKGSG